MGSIMGGSSEQAWPGYTEMLLRDTKEQTIEVPDTEEKTATAIRRHPTAKDGFLMYAKDDDSKSDLDSGWASAKVAFEKFADHKCFGYRPFEDPLKDPLKRGKYQFDTYATVAKQVYAAGNGAWFETLSAECKDC